MLAGILADRGSFSLAVVTGTARNELTQIGSEKAHMAVNPGNYLDLPTYHDSKSQAHTTLFEDRQHQTCSLFKICFGQMSRTGGHRPPPIDLTRYHASTMWLKLLSASCPLKDLLELQGPEAWLAKAN